MGHSVNYENDLVGAVYVIFGKKASSLPNIDLSSGLPASQGLVFCGVSGIQRSQPKETPALCVFERTKIQFRQKASMMSNV